MLAKAGFFLTTDDPLEQRIVASVGHLRSMTFIFTICVTMARAGSSRLGFPLNRSHSSPGTRIGKCYADPLT